MRMNTKNIPHKKLKVLGSIALFMVILSACSKLGPELPADDAVLDGPVSGLTAEQERTFLAGDVAFGQVFTPETGLGPIFVASSCAGCHAGDGKGHPSTALVRFGKTDGGTFNHMLNEGGPQLQNRAIPGYVAEAIPTSATGVTKFIAPAVTGLGYLELVSDADILALADPNDANGDGISGVPHYISPPEFFTPLAHHIADNGKYIGRFGKKANAIDLLMQTVGAYKQDMGITTDFDMEDPINFGQTNLPNDNIADPELPASAVHAVVFYLRTLKAPIQRDTDNPDVIAGKQVFMNINCSGCHTPTLKTGASNITALNKVEFHPYTDMLLHDMGPGLDDNYQGGDILTSEWKTPALWGLGLSADAQGGKMYLLHDGRASSIEQAITLHGGEATNSVNAYKALSETERQQLLTFLKSL